MVCLVQPPSQKYFCFSEAQIRLHDLPSRPTEGRWPSSLTRGGMRWTRRRQACDVIASAAQRVRTNGAVSAFAGVSADGYQARRRLRRRRVAYGKAVWSWRPDAGVKFLRNKFLRDDGGKKARSPGRARYKP